MTLVRSRHFLLLLVSAVVLCSGAGCAALYATNPRYSRKKAAPRQRPKPEKRPEPVVDHRQGKLGWPAVGAVVGTYGIKVDSTYGTKTKKLGIDIATASGVPVKAVYGGRVSFADRFMGYGRTVIIDHGERLHSIYSRLSEIGATVGTGVKQGETIGFAGDTLHFQVRKNGQSVDPERWLGPK